jgi:phage N-6-adenine-methyltransferase
MNKDLMFSSATDDWATPKDFFDKLNKAFRFDLDVCASEKNAKCARFFTKEQNGLMQDWVGICWMNPPYGRGIGDWVKKAYDSAKVNGSTVVCLIPARTDTRWWHEYVAKGEVYFVPGRLKFGDSKNSAPFPCAVVVFRPQVSWALESVK